MKFSRYVLGVVCLLSLCAITAPAGAQFSGAYAPGNWTFNNFDADGSIDITNAPNSVTLTGGDLSGTNVGQEISGFTTYSIASAGNGTVFFNYAYQTLDVTPAADPFYFSVNGGAVFAIELGPESQSGSFSASVSTGDLLTFQINTDNLYSRASVTISNFSVSPTLAPVPEPGEYAVMGMIGMSLGGLMLRARRRRRTLSATALSLPLPPGRPSWQ